MMKKITKKTAAAVLSLALRAVNWPTDYDIVERCEDNENIKTGVNRCDNWAKPYVELVVFVMPIRRQKNARLH